MSGSKLLCDFTADFNLRGIAAMERLQACSLKKQNRGLSFAASKLFNPHLSPRRFSQGFGRASRAIHEAPGDRKTASSVGFLACELAPCIAYYLSY
jgi:hypothetical protein